MRQLRWNRSVLTQPGRHERAFRPARGPFRTGPYGPGPTEKLAGPSPEKETEIFSVRSGLYPGRPSGPQAARPIKCTDQAIEAHPEPSDPLPSFHSALARFLLRSAPDSASSSVPLSLTLTQATAPLPAALPSPTAPSGPSPSWRSTCTSGRQQGQHAVGPSFPGSSPSATKRKR